MSVLDLSGRLEASVGRGGRLFIDRAPEADVRQLYAEPWTDAARLRRSWSSHLDRLSALAREIGARLLVVVPPDAHAVHTADLPDGAAYARPSVTDCFANLFGHEVEVLDLRPVLISAKTTVDPWRRTDSHWSAAGAYAGYRALMDRLSLVAPRAVQPDAFSLDWREEAGDLGAVCDPPRRAETPTVHMDEPRARIAADLCNHRRHMIKVTEVDDPSLPSAVLLRDSFATEIAPFLAESFRRCVMVGSGARSFLDLVREERPDVILVERCERALPQGVIDWDLLGWREHWPAPGDGEREADAARAERDAARALDAGDAAGAVTRATDACTLGETPDRRALLGRTLLASSRADEAAVAFEQAVAVEPGRWSFVMHLGVARLAQNRMAEARDLFGRACALSPWRPFGFEHFGYASLALGEHAAARAALEEAVRLGPELLGSWMWLLRTLEAQGDEAALARAKAAGARAPVDIPDLAA